MADQTVDTMTGQQELFGTTNIKSSIVLSETTINLPALRKPISSSVDITAKLKEDYFDGIKSKKLKKSKKSKKTRKT